MAVSTVDTVAAVMEVDVVAMEEEDMAEDSTEAVAMEEVVMVGAMEVDMAAEVAMDDIPHTKSKRRKITLDFLCIFSFNGPNSLLDAI